MNDEDIENSDFSSSYSQWNSPDGSRFFPISKSSKRFKPGLYSIQDSYEHGIYFKKEEYRKDELIHFPSTSTEKILFEIRKFLDREQIYREYGISYTRKILYHGPPGSGKSSNIRLAMDEVFKRDGVAFLFPTPGIFLEGLAIFQRIQPETLIAVLMEDFDEIIEKNSGSEITNLLDGIHPLNRILFIATTNYRERLEERVINRPGRFDKQIFVGHPTPESRRLYLESLITKNGEFNLAEKLRRYEIRLSQWVDETDKFSLSHLKDLFTQVVIIGNPYCEALESLREMIEDDHDSEED